MLNTKNGLADLGIAWLDTGIDKVQFKRVNSDYIDEDKRIIGSYSRWNHGISLSNRSFTSDLFGIYHEIGHSLDDVAFGVHSTYARESGGYWGDFLWSHWYTGDGYYFRDYATGCFNCQYEAFADGFGAWLYYKNDPEGDNLSTSGVGWVDGAIMVNWENIYSAVETSLVEEYDPD